MWGIVPESNSLTFIDREGNPIKGKVTAYKATTSYDSMHRYYYGRKSFNPIFATELSQGGFAIANSPEANLRDLWFSSRDITGTIVYPTNWYVSIEQEDGKTIGLHLPIAAFNMPAMNGENNATYTIQLLQEPTGVTNQQIDMIVGTQVLPEPTTAARMVVSGTPVQFFWSNS